MPHVIKLELSDEDEKRLMHGNLGEGINVVRRQVGMGLIECKRLVENIRSGAFVVERGKPKKPCPHCKGSGMIEDEG